MPRRDNDTPAATSRPAALPESLTTPVALGIILVGALLALAGLRVGFKGAVSTSIGS